MWQKIARWLLYRRMGWNKHITEPHPDKYIICLAPHTSNYDFLIGILYRLSEGWKINFLMKREWFFWPLGGMFRRLGGIAVQRDRHSNLTQQLVDSALERQWFHLCVTPEGTRSKNSHWKHGFYHIANQAKIPILLYGIDYENKLIQCTRTLVPSGNIQMDQQIINKYYSHFRGKHPDNFLTDEMTSDGTH